MHHVYSVELDKQKRSYLMKAFPQCDHVFADVACFHHRRGFCYTCDREHDIDDAMMIDLLLSGPSCKDLSITTGNRSFLIYIYICRIVIFHIYIYIHIRHMYIYIYLLFKHGFICSKCALYHGGDTKTKVIRIFNLIMHVHK